MAYATYYPRRINLYVANCSFAADHSNGPANTAGPYRVQYGAVPALSATSLVNVSAAFTTGVVNTLSVAAGTILNGGLVGDPTTCRWGRGLQFVASAACTRTIAVAGWDYLGQKQSWTGTMNGTTPVLCPKAFMWVDSVAFGASADVVTVNIGNTNVLGLPFASETMINEIKNGTVAANAGTFTGWDQTVPQTATTGDTKGTYLPVTVIPNGTNTFEVLVMLKETQLHGLPAA